jgi:hypothetical protein
MIAQQLVSVSSVSCLWSVDNLASNNQLLGATKSETSSEKLTVDGGHYQHQRQEQSKEARGGSEAALELKRRA